jgi:hypothetical protein
MAGPMWIRWVWTLLFAAMAGYCVLRLVAASRAVRSGHRDYGGRNRFADVAHLLTSLGMAVMASPVGGPFAPASWQALFCLMAGWSLTRFRDNRPDAWHVGAGYYLVTSAAMVYMLVHDGAGMAAPWAVHGASPGGPLLPALAWAFAVYFVLHAGWMLARARVRIGQLVGTGGALLMGPSSEKVVTACHLVMALGMAYLLLAA